MIATVLPFVARHRRETDTVRLRLEKDGGLRIHISGAPPITIPEERVIPTLETLLLRATRARYERMGIEWRREEKASPVPRSICRKRRDGGRIGIGGCRRNERHAGECKDAGGTYTPALCTHQGRKRCRVEMAQTGEVFWQCQHCGEGVES